MPALIELVLLNSRAIRGPGKPRIVEPYVPFFAPLDWLQSGAQNALWRQKRLLPLLDYVERLKTLDDKELYTEAARAGVPAVGDIIGAITAKLGVTLPPVQVGIESLEWAELRTRAKELGINAKQSRDALIVAILEAEALNGGQVGD
jgi:hypothetical protein